MPIERWSPSQSTTKQEERLLARLKRTRKLFRFLREHRLELFDDAFQAELESMYRDSGAGKDPVSPALMAMATLLQGYVGASDAEAVELTMVDLRWQMVLDRLGATTPAFSQGALHDFRQRLIAHDLDRRLLERTRELARRTKGFDYKRVAGLRIAMDSAPLEGAGRVEDTINLLGHAARNLVRCAAELLGLSPDTVAREAGIPVLLAPSIKQGLDRTWTEAGEKAAAVEELALQVQSLHQWLRSRLREELRKPPLKKHVETLQQILDQNLDEAGTRVRKGVAKDRRISIEDGEMRHGRKSSSKRFDGYKRHIGRDLDDGLVLACAVAPANVPELEAAAALNDDIEAQGETISELYIDRGYISSPLVSELIARGGEVMCRPWQQGNGELFPKEDFALDLDGLTITCPAGQMTAIKLGATVRFPKKVCGACALRPQCTTAKKNGRSVRIGDDERLQQQLREKARTPEGRARLRERVPVEHGLAHVVHRQGRRARYMGVRSNLYDLRRACSILNLEAGQLAVDRAEPMSAAA